MGDIYGVIRKDINKIVYIGQTIRTYKVRWQQHKQTEKNADSFLWSLIKADCMPKYISRNRPIIQLTKDGKYIQTFSSARQAALYLNKNHGEANIHNVAKGRRKTAYGYQW